MKCVHSKYHPGCPSCQERGAARQLAWMEEMDRIAQEELGARPRGEVIVELESGPVSNIPQSQAEQDSPDVA